jgi:large subunit ribosomal protein L10
MTSHTRPWKEAQLERLKKLASEYPVVAVADINMYPAALFQQVRKKLHGRAVVVVSKTRVLKKALSESKNTESLIEFAEKNCAVIFTDLNPFELFAFLKKNKGKVSAKEGAIAEDDIMIPAGDTGLPPGPALSDLKGAGLKVAVQGATISVIQDKVVTKAGEPISLAVAGTLSKLNIKPFKVGLKLISALEEGQVYGAEVLNIDVEQVFSNFCNAHRHAFNLAFNAEIFNSATTELLLSNAFLNAKSVCIEANFLTSATVEDLIAKAGRQANALKPLVKENPAQDSPAKPEEEPQDKKEDA